MTPFVSIIVPVYNVEKFIESCARSLFEQTIRSRIEYIFVDDCSSDGSVEVLRRVIDAYKVDALNVKIVSHEQNRGPGSARNTGLKIATGEYIFYCDSDDWIEFYAMEKLYEAAQETQADLLWFDWYLSFQKKERWMREEAEENPMTCLKAILSGKLKFNLWNKLVKRRLYLEHEIYFAEGFCMAEDMMMIKVYAFVEKVCYVPLPLYHYIQGNTSSLTKSYSEKSFLQIRQSADDVISFLQGVYGNQLHLELNFFKLNVKLPFLISKDKVAYKHWLNWYPEANRHIKQNRIISYKVRLLQQMALHRQFWFVRLYYFLVYQVIAKILYR